MAAFFLYNEKVNFNQDKVVSHFNSINIDNYSKFKLGTYNLLLFKKELINANNYVNLGNYELYTVGSIVYKGKNYKDSLELILSDLINNSVDFYQLRGIYTLIFYNKSTDNIRLIIDPTLSKNLYIDFNDKIISSHFLPLIKARPNVYRLNKLALYESVFTGSLIQPGTYAINIERISNTNINKIEKYFNNTAIFRYSYKPKAYKNKEEALTDSNNLIDEYFKSFREIDKENGTHIGLTGGFDSRLLLINAINNLSNLNTNSFYRKNSLEYTIAKELAKVTQIEFTSHESENYSDKEFINPDIVLNYLDGQIRSQNYINEPFTHPSYSNSLYKNKYVGFHGCGGEQYRNADRIKNISLSSFIENEWFITNLSSLIIDRKLEKELKEYIYFKIQQELNIDKDKLGLYDIKRLQNEIWNPANRLTRVNALNQSLFYFAPFTEWQLSLNSYSLTPFLGLGNKFQVEMMQLMGHKLNSIKTTHGYSVDNGVSLKEKTQNLVSYMLPRSTIIKAFKLIKKSKPNKNFDLPENRFILNKVLNINTVKSNIELSNNIYALNYLLPMLQIENL